MTEDDAPEAPLTDGPDEGTLLSTGPRPGARRAERQGGLGGIARRLLTGCLPVLLGLALIAGVIIVGYRAVGSLFGDPADYSGKSASGRVVFEVTRGQGPSEVGRLLEKKGVVASDDAFTDAVDELGANIQPGVFVLKKKMAAADVAKILGDRANDKSIVLTLLPGKTNAQIVALLGDNSPFKAKQYQDVLDHPDQLQLPSYAHGDSEGYLYPDRYVFGPDDTPATILRAMVARFTEVADQVDLTGAAERLGHDPGELVTVASMVQAEGRASVQSKIARVLYNRLDKPTGPTAGFLQVDATVNYALGENPSDRTVRLTQAQIDSVASNPYNTYKHKGLPPGPIETPGLEALKAAANPADGPWFFYVTVNLRTGETKFATTFSDQQKLKAELDEYCATKSDRC